MSHEAAPSTLGPVRHACHSCGACCTGWRVGLSRLEERERVIMQAAILGIDEPIVEGAIRRVDGRCVFLREDKLCAIHARFGEHLKPTTCQYFPRRSLYAEDGLRAGADPGCTSSWMTFDSGPVLAPWPVAASDHELIAPDLAAAERALVRLCRARDMSLPLFSAIITGDHAHLPDLSPAFLTRMLERLKRVSGLLDDPKNGAILNAMLAPIRRFVLESDPAAPPAWPEVPRASEAFAFDLMARHLFLRLGDHGIAPIGHTLMLLAGVFACAFVDPALESFGPALAAWSRLCRLDVFWNAFMPDPETGRRLLKGA